MVYLNRTNMPLGSAAGPVPLTQAPLIGIDRYRARNWFTRRRTLIRVFRVACKPVRAKDRNLIAIRGRVDWAAMFEFSWCT